MQNGMKCVHLFIYLIKVCPVSFEVNFNYPSDKIEAEEIFMFKCIVSLAC